MSCVIKGQFYRRITGKLPFYGHSLVISLQNAMVKNFGSHKVTVLFPYSCYKEVCYKGTALYIIFLM